jgi:hypothetical protein
MNLKIKLSLFLILCFGVCFAQSTEDSLTAHFSFDGNANDISGNDNHGIVYGAELTDDRYGEANSAYLFDGDDDYIAIENYENFNNMDEYTVTAWVYPMDINSYCCILSKVNPNRDIDFKLYNGRLSLEFYNNGTYYVCRMDDSIPINSWTFVAGTWDGYHLKIYVNGEHIKTADFSGSSPAWTGEQLQIGKLSGIEAFNGKIDEVKVYRRELTETEIRSLFLDSPNISLSIDILSAFKGDTLMVPLNVTFTEDSLYSSLQINIGGYFGKIEFINLVLDNSLAGDAGWTFQVNESDSLNISWFAGAEDISGEGILFWLKFAIPDTASGFIPITIESAIFNTDEQAVSSDGGVQVFPFLYGDVDLNQQIQAYDAALILKHVVGSTVLDTFQLSNANVSLDTSVSAFDASLILQYGVGLIDSLPIDTGFGVPIASGNIIMENITIGTGSTVDIPLYVYNGDSISSFEGKIWYNPEHLIFNDFILSDSFEDFLLEKTDQYGEIKFAAAGTMISISEGILSNLKLAVRENLQIDSTTVQLRQIRWNEGDIQESMSKSVLSFVTGIEGANNRPSGEYRLHQNYPNPFNPVTKIEFRLLRPEYVTIEIYNINGERLKTLVNKNLPAGNHQVEFNAADISGGVYYYRLVAGKFHDVKKMILLK